MINPFETIEERLNKIEGLILDIKKQPTTQKTETDQLLTIKQASAFLNLSKNTLYGYVQRATIPVSKKGKRLYFSKRELTDWIKEGRKKTIKELSQEADHFLTQTKKA